MVDGFPFMMQKGGKVMEKMREHFIFYGRVQGVGFRYKMEYAAAQYKVTGMVSNEYSLILD